VSYDPSILAVELENAYRLKTAAALDFTSPTSQATAEAALARYAKALDEILADVQGIAGDEHAATAPILRQVEFFNTLSPEAVRDFAAYLITRLAGAS
jgi:hypothetical protein